MLILSKLPRLLFVFLMMAVAARGGENPPALESLVQAERSFAHASVEHGIRASFLQFFADDGMVFTSIPRRGKEVYSAYQEKGEQLSWEPAFAAVSHAGDLGCTTGPWSLKASAADTKPVAFGEFASIWKRQSDNQWKVIVDLGIDHPGPANHKELELLPPETEKAAAAKPLEQLKIAQTALLDRLRNDSSDPIISVAHEKIRALRPDNEPAIGKEAAKYLLQRDHAQITRNKMAGGVSRSGDLAYEYGSYSAAADKPERGHFLSVWRLDRSGSWKLVLDVQKKAQKSNESG
jgi:ketosteroid isomerase-like protein